MDSLNKPLLIILVSFRFPNGAFLRFGAISVATQICCDKSCLFSGNRRFRFTERLCMSGKSSVWCSLVFFSKFLDCFVPARTVDVKHVRLENPVFRNEFNMRTDDRSSGSRFLVAQVGCVAVGTAPGRSQVFHFQIEFGAKKATIRNWQNRKLPGALLHNHCYFDTYSFVWHENCQFLTAARVSRIVLNSGSPILGVFLIHAVLALFWNISFILSISSIVCTICFFKTSMSTSSTSNALHPRTKNDAISQIPVCPTWCVHRIKYLVWTLMIGCSSGMLLSSS